jgi:hypothetical protein
MPCRLTGPTDYAGYPQRYHFDFDHTHQSYPSSAHTECRAPPTRIQLQENFLLGRRVAPPFMGTSANCVMSTVAFAHDRCNHVRGAAREYQRKLAYAYMSKFETEFFSIITVSYRTKKFLVQRICKYSESHAAVKGCRVSFLRAFQLQDLSGEKRQQAVERC